MADHDDGYDEPKGDGAADTRAHAVKSYTRPALTEYGSISKLTRSGGATRREGGSPRMRAMM